MNSNSPKIPSKLQSSREELLSKRYNLVEPKGVYRLDQSIPPHKNPKYPDFLPWKHSTKEDEIALNNLQKGYFEPPSVSNELLSARNIIYQLLRCDNSLQELSSNLLKSIEVRTHNNKISQGAYKPPPRVTLTDQKREAWLKDLASNDVPLRKLSRTIPHGVRNKVLIEHCINKNIPMNRAIWFVRCVGTNELRGLLKRKNGINIEINWIQEWTLQIIEFFERLSLDYLKFETFKQATESWKFKINYLLRFISNLFIENLIDKEFFFSWINKFFKNSQTFELPLALTIIKIFWNEIIKSDYLIKELTESLILKYYRISNLKNVLESKDLNITDSKLNDSLKAKILKEVSNLIIESFNQSIDNFILPNSWNQLRSILKNVLNLKKEEVVKKFELISYRNESLMINSSTSTSNIIINDLVSVLDKFKNQWDFNKLLDSISNEDWKDNIETLINWSITKYRYESYRVLLVIKIFKKLKQQQQILIKDVTQVILDFIFELHKLIDVIDFNSLSLLLNQLIEINLFKTSIYIRRLVSSGLIYLSNNENEKLFHGSIIKNLKPIKSSQSSLFLKNLIPDYNDYMSIDEKLKISLDFLEENNNEFDLNYFNKLEVGLKLKISDLYLQSILLKDNFFQLLTYREFKLILKIFLHLDDFKNLITFIIKSLDSKELNFDQLELVTLFIMSNLVNFQIVGNLNKIFELISINQKILINNNDELINLNSFWKFVLDKVDDDNLLTEINFLLNSKANNVNNSVIIEYLNNISNELIISLDSFLNYDDFHTNFNNLIKLLFSSLDVNLRKSIVKLISILKNLNPIEFNKNLFIFIKKTYSNANELFKIDPLYDLIVSELISIDLLVETFMNFNPLIYKNFIIDLLFKEISQPESYDFFKLQLLRCFFKKLNPQILLKLMKISIFENDLKIESIQSDSTELINSLFVDKTLYKSEFLTIFLENLIHNRDLIIKIFIDDDSFSKNKLISLLNETLLLNNHVDLENDENESIENSNINEEINFINLLKNLKNLNKFNLPIFQMLFKLNLDSDLSNEEITSIFKYCFENITDNNLFGSLFELLDPKLKIKFIYHLESSFLNSNNFPNVKINEKTINLRIISDILTSLSRSIQNIELTDELVFSLDVCLESLLKIVSQNTEMNDLLHGAISLFFKIIIIHKSFIVGIVIERNSIKESFLNNIVNLLNSKLVSSNLQLKNLLYDLIISIKTNVNELNIQNQSTNIKLPISILNLPNISSKHELINNYSNNNKNFHDLNTLNNFIVYQKSTSSYHDFNFKSFDLLEDSNPIENVNDTAISLQLFEGSLERKNPSINRN